MSTNPIPTIPDDQIKDFIDGTLRKDTPEEYVRQNIERRLVIELDYPPERIAVEFPIKIGSSTRRVDLAIFPEGAEHVQDSIELIIECKRDSIEPSAKKDGVGQLKSYISACPNAQWGMWTNGRFKAVYRLVRGEKGHFWEEPNDIPGADGDIEQVDRPNRDSLRHASADNLLFSFKTCHNHIYVTDGLQKGPAFFELLKVIFCKIHDERNFPAPLEFFSTAKEKASQDGRLTVARRIGKIFSSVKKRYPAIFDPTDEIRLQPRSLSWIVGELQRYSFLETNIDVKGKAYEELVGANLRGDRGEFFTPRNVQFMAIEMLDIREGERVLDPACGTGGFLVIAMNAVIQHIKEEGRKQRMSSAALRAAVDDKVRELAGTCFFGIDINPDLVKATKMNMVMNNDGAGNILRQDSLLHPHQWETSFRRKLANSLDLDADDLRGPDDLSHFDVIATNPPFGSKLPIKDAETLSQYGLGHVWVKEKERWRMTDQLRGSQPPEILFIERCWQFLKPGGRMAIVLPDAILGAPGLEYVRWWIIQQCRLIASVDLHPDTFQPRNGTQTSVLLLQRKTARELSDEAIQGHPNDYDIFMAQVHAIGHDKRGNNLYKRDADGLEILLDQPAERTTLFEMDALGEPSKRLLRPQKVLDDDTPQIANEFRAWKKPAVLGW